MVTRTLPPLSEKDLEVLQRKVESAADDLGVTWIRSHVTADGKHSFCELEAASVDVCRQHSKAVPLPYDDIVQLGIELGGAFQARKVG